jgi:hypothetical protein
MQLKPGYTPENLRKVIKRSGKTRAQFAAWFAALPDCDDVTGRAIGGWCINPFDQDGKRNKQHRTMPARYWQRMIEHLSTAIEPR